MRQPNLGLQPLRHGPRPENTYYPIHLFRWAGTSYITERRWPACIKNRCHDRKVRCDQTYHQECNPDRTFHTLSPVRVPWER